MSLLLCALVSLASGEDDDGARAKAALPSPGAPQRSTLTSAATEQAVEAGLLYLAALQARAGDGSFSITDVDREDCAPLGVTALCTLAFLAAGSAPHRGP